MFKSRVRKLEERIESLEKASATQTIKIEVSCMNIGENIKNRRISMQISQKDLASAVGVSIPMICQIERGTKIPSMLLGRSIAQALECKVEDLYGEA